MGEELADNLDLPLSESDIAPAVAASAATAAGSSRRRRGQQAAPEPEPETPTEVDPTRDTFATPSEPSAQQVESAPLVGPEPAVFGGINPPSSSSAPGTTPSAQIPDFPLPVEPETSAIADPLDVNEPLKPEHFLGVGADIDLWRVVRSTPFLVVALILCLVADWLLVQSWVETITFVHIPVQFSNYANLDKKAREDLWVDIETIVRSYQLRKEAWELLQKKQPDLLPGFYNTGLAFYRDSAIAWDADGKMHLRVDSDDPSTDVVRLAVFTEAFAVAAQERNKQRDMNAAKLKNDDQQLLETLQKDAALKQQIEAVDADAHRYFVIREAMQGTERFIELTDETNPLRLVARRNLMRLSTQAKAARAASEKRDELLATRAMVQRQRDDLRTEMEALRRAIDTFSSPLPADPKAITITDTRDRRTAILRNTWIGIIALYVGIFFLIHYVEHRTAETQRRERRLRRQPKAQTAGTAP
jgi:hypothetical protein